MARGWVPGKHFFDPLESKSNELEVSMASSHQVQAAAIGCSTAFKLETSQEVAVFAKTEKALLCIAHPLTACRLDFGVHIRLALCGGNFTSSPRIGKAAP